jgi:hypothetical protein
MDVFHGLKVNLNTIDLFQMSRFTIGHVILVDRDRPHYRKGCKDHQQKKAKEIKIVND